MRVVGFGGALLAKKSRDETLWFSYLFACSGKQPIKVLLNNSKPSALLPGMKTCVCPCMCASHSRSFGCVITFDYRFVTFPLDDPRHAMPCLPGRPVDTSNFYATPRSIQAHPSEHQPIGLFTPWLWDAREMDAG